MKPSRRERAPREPACTSPFFPAPQTNRAASKSSGACRVRQRSDHRSATPAQPASTFALCRGRDAPDYSHRFHAGNVGDVWKHAPWSRFWDRRTAPRCAYLRSHAGDGRYPLATTGEWTEGIGRLWRTCAVESQPRTTRLRRLSRPVPSPWGSAQSARPATPGSPGRGRRRCWYDATQLAAVGGATPPPTTLLAQPAGRRSASPAWCEATAWRRCLEAVPSAAAARTCERELSVRRRSTRPRARSRQRGSGGAGTHSPLRRAAPSRERAWSCGTR